MDVNVTVAVRCRDLIRNELTNNCACVVNVNENKIIVKLDGEEGNKEFSFDHCFGFDSSNIHIFNELVEPLVIKALDGFNATVVAYGQTSAGKTHTLHGIFDESGAGLFPLACHSLFNKIAEKAAGTEPEILTEIESLNGITVKVSYLQIYNERITDLFNPSSEELNIKESNQQGLYVRDLTELVCVIIVLLF